MSATVEEQKKAEQSSNAPTNNSTEGKNVNANNAPNAGDANQNTGGENKVEKNQEQNISTEIKTDIGL